MSRILVGFPTKDTIDAEAAVAAANLDRCGHDIVFANADGKGVYGAAQARNRIASKAVEGGFDYVLMIDADTIVPPDTISVLLDPPAPIVLGLYRYKNSTGAAPFFKFKEENGSDKWMWDEIPADRFKVKAAGLGCALIDVEIFNNIPLPWFHWDERPTGKHTGEDVWFCNAARQAGFDIVADGRVKCKHVGRKVYA